LSGKYKYHQNHDTRYKGPVRILFVCLRYIYIYMHEATHTDIFS